MEDLSNFSKKQIRDRANDYHMRLQKLMQMISNQSESTIIQEEYTDIKQRFQDELRYFDADKHSIMDVSTIHNCYQSGVKEAVERGFSVKSNAPVDVRMLHAVMDADDHLMYYLNEYGTDHDQ